MPIHSRHPRGFTLLEVMTAGVILLILSALALTYGVYGRGRARMNNAVFDMAALISTARLRAISHGTPQYLFIHQTPESRVRIHTVERPDAPPAITNWNALDLSQGIGAAIHGQERDTLVLSAGTGLDSPSLRFLDLDSPRLGRPLRAPFQAIALTSPASDGPPDLPTDELMAGCNFCVGTGGSAYGVLRFTPHGTVEVMTGNAPAGAALAFAPGGEGEEQFTPRLLTVSAPAGAITVF